MSESAPAHDDSVTYAHARVWQVDVKGWEFSGLSTPVPIADGLCPECHGAAQGGQLLDVENLDVPSPDQVRWINAACRCGYPHGNSSKDSCGRYWMLPLPGSGAP